MATMETWIRLNASTVGKDKLVRLVQYLSRLVWHNLESRKHLRDAADRMKVLESTLSTFRKLLRFGKSLEVLYGALRTLHLPDLMLRVTLTLSRIYQFFFLLVDHIIWLGRTGLCEINRDRWAGLSNRFWLGSIVLNLIRDAYELLQLSQKKIRCLEPGPCVYRSFPVIRSVYSMVPVSRPLVLFAEDHRDVFWDSVKNVCDLWIPLTNLGHVKLSPGMVGLLGAVSSAAGLIAVLDPVAKLSPT